MSFFFFAKSGICLINMGGPGKLIMFRFALAKRFRRARFASQLRKHNRGKVFVVAGIPFCTLFVHFCCLSSD